MLNADFSKPFLLIPQIGKIHELAAMGSYTPEVLIEDSIKHLLKDRISIENSLNLLIDSNLVKIDSTGICIAKPALLDELINKIIETLEVNNVLIKIANALSQPSADGIRSIDTYKLFPNYRGVLSLATSLKIIRYDEDNNQFYIALDDVKYFKEFLESDNLTKYENGMSLERLQQQLSAQNIRGDAAEEFVLESEKIRLRDHPKLDAIKRISLSNVSAGFDIQSFESTNSKEIDKFIEVKSYVGVPGFHWSINEINFAKEKGFKYCLIVINSEKMFDNDYEIQEIRNPYEIFKMADFIKQKDGQTFEVNTYDFYITLKTLN